MWELHISTRKLLLLPVKKPLVEYLLSAVRLAFSSKEGGGGCVFITVTFDSLKYTQNTST